MQSSEVKMIFVDILKNVFLEKNQTWFKVFREYLFMLLKVSGFDILSEDFFTTPFNRLITTVMSLPPTIGLISSSCVIWKYSQSIEELITGTISFIIILQLLSKLVELIVNRKVHREMLKIVEEKTHDIKNDPELIEIGLDNFKRARFFIGCSTVVNVAALISLILYPVVEFLLNGEYKLSANLELPGTNNKNSVGWLVNYLFSVILVPLTCSPILGEIKLSTHFPTFLFLRIVFLHSAYDVLMYIYVFHIRERFQVFEHQVKMVGDFESAYNTDEKQNELLIKCSRLHSETLA